jgi:putative transcriptional regulator
MRKAGRPKLSTRIDLALRAVGEHANGTKALVETLVPKSTEYTAEDVVRIRRERGLSQSQFARLLAVSVRTLQSWEQGTRTPSGPSMRLLQVFENPREFQLAWRVAEGRKGYGQV